ncbi:8-oxoguanine DNA glycosylase [Pseudomonas taiwanensis]|uniref:8-oxoguanine DNA glycosylase n=1 Tax=Pseudomonas taiwanensis TaxID=470150 RepID=UPI001FD0295E|nr:8-oxoguanine DNA glycosylase [Pseudomonas taiwanensis]
MIVHRRQFPEAQSEVLPGVQWGPIEAFPSPAYWAYQAWADEIQPHPLNYKLGSTLREEVGACLLGGHGIPASVGLAAFAHLKGKGAFACHLPSEGELLAWLSEPLKLDGKTVHYRFARQKSRYLHAALSALHADDIPLHSGQALRNWLLSIPGIGFKTASWIARNWLDADDVAILDIHILRAGALAGFFTPGLTVERHYLQLEQEFLAFSRALSVRPSALDALMWYQMMSASHVVHDLLGRAKLRAA